MWAIILGLITLWPVWALAGQPPVAGNIKLQTPENVVCTRQGDTLIVTWDLVAQAKEYRVMLERDDETEVMAVVTAPPYSIPIGPMGADEPALEVQAKVRAMLSPQTAKGASKSSKAVVCK